MEAISIGADIPFQNSSSSNNKRSKMSKRKPPTRGRSRVPLPHMIGMEMFASFLPQQRPKSKKQQELEMQLRLLKNELAKRQKRVTQERDIANVRARLGKKSSVTSSTTLTSNASAQRRSILSSNARSDSDSITPRGGRHVPNISLPSRNAGLAANSPFSSTPGGSRRRVTPRSARSPKKIKHIFTPSTTILPELHPYKDLLMEMMNHKWSDPFNRPVDPIALNIPHYPTIIKKPMDLGTIKSKMEHGNYRTADAIDKFVDDVRLVWNNAKTFNNKEHSVHKMAVYLSAMFESKRADLKASAGLGVRGIAATSSRPTLPKSDFISSTPTRPMYNNVTELSYREKQELRANIFKIPANKLGPVVQIISDDTPSQKIKSDEIEIDIEALKPATLRKLKNYVDKTLNRFHQHPTTNGHSRPPHQGGPPGQAPMYGASAPKRPHNTIPSSDEDSSSDSGMSSDDSDSSDDSSSPSGHRNRHHHHRRHNAGSNHPSNHPSQQVGGPTSRQPTSQTSTSQQPVGGTTMHHAEIHNRPTSVPKILNPSSISSKPKPAGDASSVPQGDWTMWGGTSSTSVATTPSSGGTKRKPPPPPPPPPKHQKTAPHTNTARPLSHVQSNSQQQMQYNGPQQVVHRKYNGPQQVHHRPNGSFPPHRTSSASANTGTSSTSMGAKVAPQTHNIQQQRPRPHLTAPHSVGSNGPLMTSSHKRLSSHTPINLNKQNEEMGKLESMFGVSNGSGWGK